jgi:Ca2+-binding RTX toxin-like protein
MKQGIAITALLVAGMATAAPAGGDGPSVLVAVGSSSRGAEAASLQLEVTGSPDADEISVGFDPTRTQYVITSTHPINPPPLPCTPISTFQIQCPASEFVSFAALLGEGNDNFTVGQAISVPAVLTGGTGLDDLRGGSGSDTLLGGDDGDRLVGRGGQDTLKGAKGRDVLEGGMGRDVLEGGRGRDRLRGGKGTDTLRGGPGRDIEKQ